MKAEDLPEGTARLPIKTIHVNKSPIVIGNLKTLTPERAAQWGLDTDTALRHAAFAAAQVPLPKLLWKEVFARPAPERAADVDEDLYGGFVGNDDRRKLDRLRGLAPEKLALERVGFDDARLEELLFRYRARNHAHTLSDEDLSRWEAHRAAQLLEGGGGGFTLAAFFERIDALSENADERGEAILGALYDYAEMIAPEG